MKTTQQNQLLLLVKVDFIKKTTILIISVSEDFHFGESLAALKIESSLN